MEIVLLIIMLMVGFSLLLKLTYLPLYGRLTVCLVCALTVWLSYDAAAGQSKTRIDDWLRSPALMLDMAVLLTIDVLLQVSFCILSVRRICGEKMSKKSHIIRKITLWIPGILIFPTLFALLVEVIFSFPELDFSTLAWMLAGLVFFSGAGLSFLLKELIPEDDLRLELLFMTNALTALLGVVATVNGRTAVAAVGSVEWRPFLGAAMLLLTGAGFGFFKYRYHNNKKLSKTR